MHPADRTRIAICSLALLCLLTESTITSPQATGQAHAQTPPATNAATSAEEKIALGERYRLEGNYPKALPQMKLGLKQLENSKATPARMAAAYNYLALLNSNMGQYAESENNARKAIVFGSKAGLSENILARHRVVLANALRQQRKYAEAQTILKKVITTLKTTSSDKELLATATNNLGALYFWMGYYHQAITILEQGLTMRLKLAGGDKQNLDVANSYLDLGCTEFELNRIEKAREHLSLALAIRQKKLGADHPETLNAMANLAAFLANSKADEDLYKSQALLKHAVEGAGKKLDSHHPDLIHYQNEYAEALGIQASRLSMQGQQKAALDAIQLAIKLKEKICQATGHKNISYAIALANAAEVLKRVEKPAESKKMLTKANSVLDELPKAEQQSVDGKSIRHAYQLMQANHL